MFRVLQKIIIIIIMSIVHIPFLSHSILVIEMSAILHLPLTISGPIGLALASLMPWFTSLAMESNSRGINGHKGAIGSSALHHIAPLLVNIW
jgi:hypothetical protein